MATQLVWIICPIVFAICFVSQTAYFIYKIIQSRRDKSSETSGETTIHMTDAEATCCMGWAWTSCIDKTTNRITLKTFIAWYIVALTVDILITVIFYFIIKRFDRY